MNDVLEISYIEKNEARSLKGKDLENEIDKLVSALKYMLEKTKDIHGEYKLTEFTATAGLKLGVWILEANGGVTLKWEYKDEAQG